MVSQYLALLRYCSEKISWYFLKCQTLFFQEIMIWHFMQIVSYGDILHEMSNPIFSEK